MSIKNTVANMLGMNFGSYKASVNNMNKVYQHDGRTSSCQMDAIKMQVDGCYEENGKHVATASYSEQNGEFNYSVWDNKMKRTYSSGWNNNSDKFNYITFDGFAVEDANKNGVLDETDLIYVNDGQGNKQTIKEFLG